MAKTTITGKPVEYILTERVLSDGWKDRHDPEKGVVKGVLLCGLESKNRRRYSEKALQESLSMYEGAAVNFNHPEGETRQGKARTYAERFGVAKNVRLIPGKGVVGEIHYNPHHAEAKSFGWWVDNHPEVIGMSPNQRGTGRMDPTQGVMLVENITRVRSLDIVADPATAENGLFLEGEEVFQEGVLAERLAERSALRVFTETCDMAMSLVRNAIYSEDPALSLDDRKTTVVGVLKEWGTALGKNTSSDGEQNLQENEDVDMDWKDLKLDELKKHRPDLAEAILAESVNEEEEQTLLEENQDLKKRLSKFERGDKIKTLAAKHKLPDTPECRSEKFMTLLESVEDDELLEGYIEERANAFGRQATKKKGASSEPNGGTHGSKSSGGRLDRKTLVGTLKGE